MTTKEEMTLRMNDMAVYLTEKHGTPKKDWRYKVEYFRWSVYYLWRNAVASLKRTVA